MSFYNAFIQSSRQDDEIDDIRYHLTRLLESEAPIIAVENSLSEVRRKSFQVRAQFDLHPIQDQVRDQ